jgi:hypothetical protein
MKKGLQFEVGFARKIMDYPSMGNLDTTKKIFVYRLDRQNLLRVVRCLPSKYGP